MTSEWYSGFDWRIFIIGCCAVAVAVVAFGSCFLDYRFVSDETGKLSLIQFTPRWFHD